MAQWGSGTIRTLIGRSRTIMAGSGAKRKILAIGPIEGAFADYEALSRDFDVHLIDRGPRDQVSPTCPVYFISELIICGQVKEQISTLCQTLGPFEAAFMTFANFSYAPIDHDLLSPLWTSGNHLRVLAQCGTGYDNVVVGDMTSEGCYFTNTPDAVTQSTADFTVFLFLAVLRGTSYCEMVARSGLWHQGLELSTDPAGLTLGESRKPPVLERMADWAAPGIFGMGRIGKDFVKKVRAFGVKIMYNTRNQIPPDVEAELGIRWVNKEELLRTSDLIACLCPGTRDTYHMIDTPQFALMKGEPSPNLPTQGNPD